MAKLPAFQFYPGDWMKDANLRRCTPAARGVWIDMLCLMFESEERGVLCSGGTAWSDQEIASAISGNTDDVLAAIAELLGKGVARRREDGSIYSLRMVRDEQLRASRASAGSKGGSKTQANTQANGQAKCQAKSGSSSSSSSSPSGEVESADSEESAKSPGHWPEELTQAVLGDAYMIAQRIPTSNRDRIACCKAAFLVHSGRLPSVWLTGCLGECERASPRNPHGLLFEKFVERAAEFDFHDMREVWKSIKIPALIWKAIPITKEQAA